MGPEYFDVVIIGGGISGIGSAYHLQKYCPAKTFTILEARDAIGGTWDLFRYPGIRSDSDMYTFGYRFKPWMSPKAIADADSILAYLNETVEENQIGKHIQFGQKVVKTSWSTEDALWTVDVVDSQREEERQISCNFVLMCAGYYSYENGYTPEFKGQERFQGPIIHPQKWPANLNYKDKKVVVIGSGATAVTLIPNIAPDAAHVTMLQRSPSYVASRPAEDKAANTIKKLLPAKWAHALIRMRNVAFTGWFYNLSRKDPEKVKTELIELVRQELNPGYDVETHFTPTYNPWDQRLCLVPDGDLFKAINSGAASVVTDHIDTFTEEGILLQSGKMLEADIIVTATGLNMIVYGNIELVVDGESIHYPDHYTYKGMMLSDVPNMIATFGYINASWTLRADLTSEFTCRVLNHMDKKKVRQSTPRLRPADHDMEQNLFIADFSSGYMQRALSKLPKQGDRAPWINPQDFKKDRRMIRYGKLDDGVLTFDNGVPAGKKQPQKRLA